MAKVLNQSLKKGFSLMELIVVIIVMGILVGLSVSKIPDYTLITDSEYILFQVKKTQSQALRYNTLNASTYTFDTHESICLDLNKTGLQNSIYNDDNKTFRDSVSISLVGLVSDTVCFDYLGRPFDNDFNLTSFLTNDVNITLSHAGDTKSVIITPYTGYSYIEP
jgi:prepilin-type N-terminal cleavage/methylation domain-containing protein